MKNKIIVLLTVLVVFLGIGCTVLLINNKYLKNNNKEEEKEVNKTEPEAIPEKITEEKYVAKDDQYSVLILRSNNTFTMDVNLCEGIGSYEGTYSKDDKKLTLTIDKIDFKGFLGDDFKSISFNILKNGNLKLNQQISCTWDGFVFAKK